MARRQVVEVVCDRCSRTETQTVDSVPKKSESGKEFSYWFNGDALEFEDLCTRCRQSVGGYLTQIKKQSEPKKKKSPNEPVETPPAKPGIFSRIAG